MQYFAAGLVQAPEITQMLSTKSVDNSVTQRHCFAGPGLISRFFERLPKSKATLSRCWPPDFLADDSQTGRDDHLRSAIVSSVDRFSRRAAAVGELGKQPHPTNTVIPEAGDKSLYGGPRA
jgi:hypothetical protein